eukprot:7168529-Lingulodinium_polyedra.AAC.1
MTDGDAASIVEGVIGCRGAEAWRRLVAVYDPVTNARNLADRLQVVNPSGPSIWRRSRPRSR